MRKISITTICRAGAYALSVLAWAALSSGSAFAKNNCESKAAAVNPAIAANSGIGGTGLYDGGIGGTGKPESGIGGTGSTADKGGIGGTGIIGVITGFASICVNGIEVHYNDHTPILVDGRISTIRELAVGQLVAARAAGIGYELTASNIAVIHAAVGPVSSVNPETGEMRVLDQTIHIGASADNDRFASLQAGDWVRVSGHRLTSGVIVASRIESTEPLTEARISGYVVQLDEHGFSINGTRIRYDVHSEPIHVSQGMEVQVAGYWDGAYLHARHILIEPIRQSLGSVEHVVIEGYVHNRDNRELNLSNRVVVLDSGANIGGLAMDDFKVDQRVQISGRVGADQRITPDRVEVINAASAPTFERIDREQVDTGGKIEMKKEIDRDPDDKTSAGKDENKTDPQNPETQVDSITSLPGMDRDSIDAKSGDKPETPDATESNLFDRMNDHRDLVRDIDDRRDFQREVEIPDNVRDFGGHHDRLFMDR